MSSSKFSENFLNELFLLCFYKKHVVECVVEHLKYEYIPKELNEYKLILKSIISTYKTTNKLPTIGIISQQYLTNRKVQDALAEIKDSKLPDPELILETLEEHIKLAQFEILNHKVYELYNSGKNDEAIKLSAKESPIISNFTIKKETSYFTKVFADFNSIHRKKQDRNDSGENFKQKVPFSIHPLDKATNGGIDKTDTALWVLRSGVGKSTALRWTGMGACRLGHNVLHIQLEGSQEETFDKYSQLWTACLYNDIKKGNINDKKYESLQKNLNWFVNQGRDIYIHAFEQFNTASMIDVRNLITDFRKIQGDVDLVIIDYLAKLHPGDGIKYGVDTNSIKMRKENVADKMKNTALEFGTRIITADQAVGISKEIWNDPKKTMDRYNIQGAKNLVDSFSYVFTGNQTEKEKDENIMRIYIDKLRNYKIDERVVKIVTNYDYGRFYNHKRTLQEFYGQ